MASALALGDGAHLGPSDPRRSESADSEVGHGGDPLQGSAQRAADGWKPGAGRPLRRRGPGPSRLGRVDRLELSAVAQGFPRAVPGVAGILPLQHGAAVSERSGSGKLAGWLLASLVA